MRCIVPILHIALERIAIIRKQHAMVSQIDLIGSGHAAPAYRRGSTVLLFQFSCDSEKQKPSYPKSYTVDSGNGQ